MAALGLCCCARAFSSCGERGLLYCGVQISHCGGFSCCRARALGVWASVVVAHGLSSCGSWALEAQTSVAVAHGLSCSAVCGIFPDQGSNPCPLALAGGFLTTAPPGKPWYFSFWRVEG